MIPSARTTRTSTGMAGASSAPTSTETALATTRASRLGLPTPRHETPRSIPARRRTASMARTTTRTELSTWPTRSAPVMPTRTWTAGARSAATSTATGTVWTRARTSRRAIATTWTPSGTPTRWRTAATDGMTTAMATSTSSTATASTFSIPTETASAAWESTTTATVTASTTARIGSAWTAITTTPT